MKTIDDYETSVTTLVSASRGWAAWIAEALEELLAPELAEDEELPDLTLLQELFGRAIDRRWRRLVTAEEALLETKERHRAALEQRRQGTRSLYREVVDLRTVLRGLFGFAASNRLFGLRGRTSRDPRALLRQADRALSRLRDQPQPSSSRELSKSDRERWAAPLREAAETLRSALAGASLATKDLDAAVVERRRAIEDLKTTFVRVAGWLEATYRAAGRERCADAVRPSRRRRGRLLEEDVRGRARATHPEAAALSFASTSRGSCNVSVPATGLAA